MIDHYTREKLEQTLRQPFQIHQSCQCEGVWVHIKCTQSQVDYTAGIKQQADEVRAQSTCMSPCVCHIVAPS